MSPLHSADTCVELRHQAVYSMVSQVGFLQGVVVLHIFLQVVHQPISECVVLLHREVHCVDWDSFGFPEEEGYQAF